MEFCLITDNTDLALAAEQAGIERILIDLERNGKAQRQAGRKLFLSEHQIESVACMKAVLKKTQVVVRVNPLADDSAAEIETVLNAQVDFVMLPYFHHLDEVRRFLALVQGRAKTILLVETNLAAQILPDILMESGVNEIYIGLNDLSISLGHQVIFEPLCNGLIEEMAAQLRKAKMPFGFGGVGRLSNLALPVHPERILAEQVRLGASVGWLGRSFRGVFEQQFSPDTLATEVRLLRAAIAKWRLMTPETLAQNRAALCAEVKAWKASL